MKNKNELRSESVFIKRIKFRMSSAVKRLFIPVIERNTIPRRPSSDMAMEKKAGLLKAYLQKNTCIMRAEYCRITDTLKHKAVDDLNMFIEAGWLRKYGKGRTGVYLLNHDGIEKTKDSQATADH